MSGKSAKLKVDGLPSSITESQLTTVLGNKRRQGGGAVESVQLIKDGEICSAIVTFEEPEAVDTILGRGDTVEIKGVIVRVQRYFESCERTTRSTPPRDARKISKTAKVEHSSQDDLSGRESSPEGAKSEPLSEKSKNRPVPKPRTVKEKSVDSKRRQSQAKSETGDSTSDLDDLSETDSSHKNEKYKASKTHKKTVKKGNKEIVDDSSASESSPEKSKNKKDKSVNKSTARKEQSPASKKPSAQNKEPNPQRRKSNTQTRSSGDEDLSGADTLAEESRYPTRKSIKAPVKGKKSALAESIPSSSDEDEDPSEPWKVTIKATVKDLGKSKEFYIYYFEDSEISQGPFYEDSLMWDGLKRNVYVTFHTKQAALDTVRFKHKPDSNLLKVEIATEGDFDTHSNLLSVHGQLCDTDEQRRELMTAVEQHTEMKIVNIIQQDEPRSAIIVFDPDTCQDVSALTWISLIFNQTRLILAPVFKTNSVRVSGIYSLTSDDTLKRYMSNKKRSCGGEVTFLKRQSPTEAVVTFKQREDFDGFLGNSDHKIEQCELHVSAYYQCLSQETYKQIGEHVKETHRVNRVDKSHQVLHTRDQINHPRDQVHHPRNQVHYPRDQVHYPMEQMHRSRNQGQSVQRSTSLHKLNCTFCPLFSSVKCNNSKAVQHTLKLCKFGTAFLMRRSQDLRELMQTCHCKYSLSQNDNFIYLTLDYPHKIPLREVKQMTKSGVDILCKYLDTFIAAQCEIDNSYIHEFQKFFQRECQEEKPVVEVFFDHKDNLAVFISEHDEAGLQNFVNKMYHNFMSHIPKFDGSAGTPSLQGAFLKGSKNVKQHLGDKENSDKESKDEVKGAAPKQDQLKLEQVIEIEETDLILFHKTNFHKEVEMRNKPMEIIFNSDKMQATIKGNDVKNVNSAHIQMLNKTRDFVRLSVRDIFSPEQLQLLNKKDVQDRINKMFEEKGHQAHFKCSADVANLFYVKPLDDAVLREIIESHVLLKTKTLDSDLVFILKSDKGQKFLSALCESTDGIRMSSLVALKEKSLQIISSSQQSDVLLKEVDRFAEANKSYQKKVQFSSGKQLFAKKFFHTKLSKITESVTPLGAKIIYNAESVTVQGLKDGVNLGETQLSNLSEQIVVQDISLKFFGIKEFLQTSEGKSLLTNVETSMSCVITSSTTESQAGLSGSSKAFQGMQTQPSRLPNLIAQAKVGECTLWFMQGDITSLKTDAIVHPIDSTLQCQSGLGRALLLRGGNSIQAELADHNMQGIPGEVENTSAGNLVNCKSVVHVVCPVFTGTEVDELEVAIKACLKHAEKQGIQSLAIPAIGTGNIFKFLPLVACKLLMRSLQQHLTATNSSLTKIFFCDVQAENVKELISRFKNVFSESVEEVGELQDNPSKAASGPPVPQKPTQAKTGGAPKSFRNIKVNLIAGEITKQKTDVIVVTVGKNLDLSKGGMTKDIVTYGGSSVQQDLMDNHGPEIPPGQFGATAGGNLKCKGIYYARLNHWQGNEERHMNELVYKMLQSADQQGLTSISIPAMGTGRLKYPADVAANAIINAISQFDTDNAQPTLNLINIVVLDANIKQAFEATLTAGGGPKGAAKDAGANSGGGLASMFSNMFGSKAKTGDKNNEKKFNSLKLIIKKGDITAEKCDAIVSGIRNSMDMASSGAVCKALLKQCGTALQDECNAKISEMEQKGFVATSAPNLNCKHIYHVSMDKFRRTWDRCISQVLTDAESQGFTSIALPALGTGARNADYQKIKKTIFGGVEYFSRNSKGTLKDVKLVIFSQEILDEFLSEGASPKHASDSSREAEVTATQSLKKVSEQVALKVYAASYPKIVTATKEINTAFKQTFKEQKDKDKEIKRLSKRQVLQLEMEGIKHCLKVSVSLEEGVITMVGFRAEGFMHVGNLLRTLVVAAVRDHHKSLSQAVEAAIQWQFEQGNEGKWRNFEPILNSELERAHKHKAKSHDIVDSRNRTYRVDFTKLKEFQVDENGSKCGRSTNVRRYDRTQEGESLPKEWDTMGDSENLKLVTLQAGSPEYKNAEQLFIKGGANMPVKKIQRIQNRSLYQQYKAKKREMDLRNPTGHVNEQKLFHGTDSTSVTAINDNGFNRSYCGKNATMHGNGVYFAVNSSYSVGYARASASGERLMYIASVLTGVSTPSQSGMTHLPNKPGTNTPYDSGNATGMFIIFHDSQAYPEYLLTF